MRILFIGIFYAPEVTGISVYATGLAEHLATRGHEVAFVTGVPNYPRWKVYPDYEGVRWRTENINGVTVHRRWHHVPSPAKAQTVKGRLLYELTFFLLALSGAVLPRPDVIVAICPTVGSGVVARILARRFNVPYAVLFQDLSGQGLTQTGLSGGSGLPKLIGRIEGWIARGAARVGIIAEGFRAVLSSLDVPDEQIEHVRNWSEIEPVRTPARQIRDLYGVPQDAVVCLHAGNMGRKQGLECLLQAAELALEQEPNLLFVLVGDGNRRESLERWAHEHRLINVKFFPVQPQEVFSSLLEASDVLLLTQKATVTDMALPSKLTAYFASGKPVLAAVTRNSEAAKELLRSGAGVIVPPEEPAALLRGISALAADESERRRIGAAGRNYAETVLSRDRVLNKLEQLVIRTVESHDPVNKFV